MSFFVSLQKKTAVGVAAAGLALAAAVWAFCALRPTSMTADLPALSRDQKDQRRKNPFLPAGAPDRGWPTIRGPDFDARSAEIHIADRWPSDGPPLLWTRPLGQGYSAFTVAEDRVFTQYQTLAGQYVVCLAAETGATIWEYRYDWPYEAGGIYPGPRATPTLYEGRIYFAGPSGLVGCLSWDGTLVWSVDIRERFKGRGADFGYSASPMLEDGVLVIPAGGLGASLVALDARDGSTVWKTGDDSASYTPALFITVEGQRQVVGYLENALACFEFETGRLLWRQELSQGYDEHAAWPVYVEPYLWISAPFRWGSKLLKLTAGPQAGAAEVWHSTLLSNDIFSSIHHDGSLYGFDLKDVQAKAHRPSRGKFRCLDLATGAARWETDETGHANVLVADDKLILLNDKGELIVARAESDRYEELARASVLSGEICWTPPALDRGRLYVRNQQRAACVFIGMPELLEQSAGQKPLTLADIPQSKYHDLAAILGVEPEYAFDSPTPRWLRTWYAIGLEILIAAAIVVAAVKAALSIVLHSRLSRRATWAVFWTLAFLAGTVAMTPLSLARNEFVFTWPVSLFVAFQAMVQEVQVTRSAGPRDRAAVWRSRIVACIFLAVCIGYYLLCRRLSLVFEWVFLSGFAAAIPVSLAGRWLAGRSRRPALIDVVFTAGAFTAYFWSSVMWLWWKYPGS